MQNKGEIKVVVVVGRGEFLVYRGMNSVKSETLRELVSTWKKLLMVA